MPLARGAASRTAPRARRREGGRTMTAGIRLRYTPDLAAAIDATGLAAYGIDAAPAALGDPRPLRAPGPLALVISAAALVSSAAAPRAAFERAAREGAAASGGPVAILLVGDDRALAPWRELMTAQLAEIPAAPALAAVVRAALDSARLRMELA